MKPRKKEETINKNQEKILKNLEKLEISLIQNYMKLLRLQVLKIKKTMKKKQDKK